MSDTIVVGVDGSAPSIAALRWAVAEAETRGTEVRAVIAWQPDPVIAGPQPVIGLPYRPEDEVRAQYRATLAAAVRQAVGDHPPVLVHQQIGRGWAPDVLVHQSADAELLVIGSHGHNWVVDRLIGSAAEHCVRHAACPVVVLPAHLAQPVTEADTTAAAEPAAEPTAEAEAIPATAATAATTESTESGDSTGVSAAAQSTSAGTAH